MCYKVISLFIKIESYELTEIIRKNNNIPADMYIKR